MEPRDADVVPDASAAAVHSEGDNLIDPPAAAAAAAIASSAHVQPAPVDGQEQPDLRSSSTETITSERETSLEAWAPEKGLATEAGDDHAPAPAGGDEAEEGGEKMVAMTWEEEEAAAEEEEEDDEDDEAWARRVGMVTSAEGLKLLISRDSLTGYRGVSRPYDSETGLPTDTYVARHRSAGYLGTYGSAAEAATAIARFVRDERGAAKAPEASGAEDSPRTVWVQCERCSKWRVIPPGAAGG